MIVFCACHRVTESRIASHAATGCSFDLFEAPMA